ncbi:G2 and S phase-expressed protein 1 [Conger conger]|uniref:G2 and S phase-expressed protein 1 n=1 Tax=Conger conger TaxID=82655 RepID=UPI002A59DFB3|nr:G2 and S phase-expressed protein 1 [Conger conger]
MAKHVKNDFVTLSEEKFDFDLPMSPASENGDAEDEDEVFVGPVGHKEKCISVGLEKHRPQPSGSGGPLSLELGSWSPLSGDKFEQIIQEAHLLARQIGENGGQEPVAVETGSASAVTASAPASERPELFVEDPEAKLSALGRVPGPVPGPAVSPMKRETYCVQDSPLKQLPPAIQQRLLKAGGLNSPRPARAPSKTGSPLQAPQPRAALRGKMGLSGGRGLLPNRPAVPGVNQRSKAKLPPPDTSRLQPPDKGGARQRRGPLHRPLSSAGSSEDLLSDASMDSLNTSLPDRRLRPGPRKTGQPPAMKAGPMLNLRTADKRNHSSSSSSSVSSLNSSLSVSPSGKGVFNTSLSSVASSARFKAPVGVGRPPGATPTTSSKPGAASVRCRAEGEEAKRPPETAMSNPAKKRNPAPPNLTPAKRPAQRAGSVPNVSALTPAAAAKGAKPKLFVAPTPKGPAGGPRRSEVRSPDMSRIMKPKKPMSVSSSESILPKSGLAAPEGLQTPTVVGKSDLALPRRSLAVSTPVNRRVSGIPTMAAKGKRLSQAFEGPGLPGSARKISQASQALEGPGLPGSARKISQASPVQLKVIQRPGGLGPKAFPREEASCGATFQPRSLAFSVEDEPGLSTVPSTPEPHPAGHCVPDQGTENRDTPESSVERQDGPESSLENRKTTESSIERQDGPESSLENQKTTESSVEGQDGPESSLENQKTTESSVEGQDGPESSLENQKTTESSVEGQDGPESSLENRKTTESSVESRKTTESSVQSHQTSESSMEGHMSPESSMEIQHGYSPASCTENRNALESGKENENSSSQQPGRRSQTDAMKTPEGQEVLLVDAPVLVLKPEEKLLIDLLNTPDLIKTAPMKPSGGQLIDLSSPLITWSPVDKTENCVDPAPLINLSF